ncbi:unnamed protein product [Rotaria magnacalcarata]
MIILIHNHQQSMLNRFRFESIDSSWIARQLNKDKTIESVLCGHSEKLAIAFKLIPRSLPEFTQITKDLRICGDCRECSYKTSTHRYYYS